MSDFNDNDLNNNWAKSHNDKNNNLNNHNETPTYNFHAENITSNESISEGKEPKKDSKKNVKKTLLKVAAFVFVAGLCFAGTRVYFNLNSEQKKQETLTGKEEELDVLPPEQNVKQVKATEMTPITMISDDTISLVTNNTMPSIVSIQSTSNEQYIWYGKEFSDESVSSGSGFIIGQNEKELFIATNNHVVEGAVKIEVKFNDDSTGEAIIKGTDSIADLAVLSVDLSTLSKETKSKIEVATLGDSDNVKVGELAIAIGNALGYGQSVTVGYISAKDRTINVSSTTANTKMTLLQTDAAINPGNSGGPLLNANGEVIGINTIKYASTEVEGMGYSIPITKALPIIKELMNREDLSEEEQGYVGISGRSVTEEVSEYYGMPVGVYVAEVTEGGSADKAGIQSGDVITGINDIEITDITQLKEKVNSIRVGHTIKVTYMRAVEGEYKEFTVDVTLMKNPTLE